MSLMVQKGRKLEAEVISLTRRMGKALELGLEKKKNDITKNSVDFYMRQN